MTVQACLAVEGARQGELRARDAGERQRQGLDGELQVDGVAPGPSGEGQPAGAGRDRKGIDRDGAVGEGHGGRGGESQPVGAAGGGEALQRDPQGRPGDEAGGAVEVEAAGLGPQRHVARLRPAGGGEAQRVEALAGSDQPIGLHMPVDPGCAGEVAAGEVRVEAGEADLPGPERGGLGPERGVLAPALAGEAEVGLQAAAEAGQRQGREVVEIRGAEGERPLGEAAREAEPGLPRQARRAEGEGEPVEHPIAVALPQMQAAGQRLAADAAGQGHAAVRVAQRVLQHGVGAQGPHRTAERRGLRRIDQGGDVGPQQGAGEPAGQARPAAQARVEGSEILEVDGGAGIGEAGGGLALQPRDHVRALQPHGVEAVAVIERGEAAGETRSRAEQPVEARLGQGEAVGAQVDLGGDRLARGVAAELRRPVEPACQRAAGEAGEDREVGQRALHRAGQRIAPDVAGIGGLQRRRLHPERRDTERVVGLDHPREDEARASADRPLQGGVGEAQSLDRRVGREGESVGAGGLGLQVRLDPVEGTVGGAKPRGPQGSERARAGERALQAAVEDEARDLGPVGLGDAALGRDGAGLDEEIGVALRVEGAARLQPGGAGGEFQPVEGERAAIGDAQPAFELGRAREHRGGGARQQALDPGGEIEGEAPLGPDPRDLRTPLGADPDAGIEIEAGVPGVERAAPVEVEGDRRLARNVQPLREQAARGLGEGGLHLQPLALGHEQQAGRELAARIDPAHAEIEVESLGRVAELDLAARREPRRLAGDGLAEIEGVEAEGLDLDLHRQVGQQGAVGLLGRRVGGGDGTAQHLDPPDLQAVHLEPPREQGEAAPDDAGPVEPQPDAVAVADRHVADGGVRGERPVHRADRDPRGRRGERLREDPAEHALLALVGGAGRGGGEDEDEHDACRDPPSPLCGGRKAGDAFGLFPRRHQKACPRLM
ncbi:hypothetical protein MET9862_04839 [Methylobacterium symbioticum]|uniref:Uncharacterized protein n=1 Tax=Methylobacterium symbioticum TaxID=2584084 RepID=A0A509EJ78_9HYPH|nr:hypothetical protein MET9862_04839 [Methylobacterium symbioticum]